MRTNIFFSLGQQFRELCSNNLTEKDYHIIMLYRKFPNMINSNTESDIFISYEDLIDSDVTQRVVCHSLAIYIYLYYNIHK